jgi:hypothetical protein
MVWNIHTAIPLLAALAYGALLAIVARAKPSNPERRAFRIYLLDMFIVSVCSMITHSGLGDTLLWLRIMTAATISSPLAIYYFVQKVRARNEKWNSWIFTFGILVVALSLFTPLLVSTATVDQGVINWKMGNGAPIIAGPGYLFYFYSLILLIRHSRQSDDPVVRNRYRYLIFGTSMVIPATAINFTPLGSYPIDVAINGINALLIAYAIIRHQLLDISIVIRRGLSYATLIVILTVTYILPIVLYENLHLKYCWRYSWPPASLLLHIHSTVKSENASTASIFVNDTTHTKFYRP